MGVSNYGIGGYSHPPGSIYLVAHLKGFIHCLPSDRSLVGSWTATILLCECIKSGDYFGTSSQRDEKKVDMVKIVAWDPLPVVIVIPSSSSVEQASKVFFLPHSFSARSLKLNSSPMRHNMMMMMVINGVRLPCEGGEVVGIYIQSATVRIYKRVLLICVFYPSAGAVILLLLILPCPVNVCCVFITIFVRHIETLSFISRRRKGWIMGPSGGNDSSTALFVFPGDVVKWLKLYD